MKLISCMFYDGWIICVQVIRVWVYFGCEFLKGFHVAVLSKVFDLGCFMKQVGYNAAKARRFWHLTKK